MPVSTEPQEDFASRLGCHVPATLTQATSPAVGGVDLTNAELEELTSACQWAQKRAEQAVEDEDPKAALPVISKAVEFASKHPHFSISTWLAYLVGPQLVQEIDELVRRTVSRRWPPLSSHRAPLSTFNPMSVARVESRSRAKRSMPGRPRGSRRGSRSSSDDDGSGSAPTLELYAAGRWGLVNEAMAGTLMEVGAL